MERLYDILKKEMKRKKSFTLLEGYIAIKKNDPEQSSERIINELKRVLLSGAFETRINDKGVQFYSFVKNSNKPNLSSFNILNQIRMFLIIEEISVQKLSKKIGVCSTRIRVFVEILSAIGLINKNGGVLQWNCEQEELIDQFGLLIQFIQRPQKTQTEVIIENDKRELL